MQGRSTARLMGSPSFGVCPITQYDTPYFARETHILLLITCILLQCSKYFTSGRPLDTHADALGHALHKLPVGLEVVSPLAYKKFRKSATAHCQ